MTEHFAGIILSASGITRMIIVRIFLNAVMMEHFAVMTREILSVTRDFAGRTKEILSVTKTFAVLTQEIFLIAAMFAGKTKMKIFLTVQTLTFF